MIITLYVLMYFFSLPAFSQTYYETDINRLAVQVNRKIMGSAIGNVIKAKGCRSLGHTLIYQYEVPDYWETPNNIKEKVISNLKTAGVAKTYFLQNMDVDFHYYKGNALTKKVSVTSNEFSTSNFQLGEYISIKGHQKAKGVNLKIKVPIGWEVKEGDRPNIVKKFVKDGNAYLILIKDGVTFYSRKQIREIFQHNNFEKELVKEVSSLLKSPQVIDQSIVTIDTYPAVQFMVKGKMERSGLTLPVIMMGWVIFYEDKMILLQAIEIDNPEFRVLEQLYSQITNSVIFPEQYD